MRHGIKTIVIPDKNKKDLEEIPQEFRDKLTFVPVKTIDDVLEVVLTERVWDADFHPGLTASSAGDKVSKVKRSAEKPAA